MTDLSGIVVPVLVAVSLSVGGSWIVAHFSSPAQQAYVAALEGRLRVVSQDRDESAERITRMEARIAQLEAQVDSLQREAIAKDHEIAKLYRRLDADERRIIHDERQMKNEP